MIERAEWRTPVDAPRSALGIHYGRERWLGLPVALWIVLYPATIFVLGRFFPQWAVPVAVVSLIPLLRTDRKPYDPPHVEKHAVEESPEEIPISGRILNRLCKPGPLQAVASLAAYPHPDAAFAVEIGLLQGRRTTGGDFGVVSFSEGWLVYEGHTTSFSLSPADVAYSTQSDGAWTIRLPERQVLWIRSYDDGWEAAIADWLKAAPPGGLSRLPPLRPNAIRRSLAAGRFQVGACLAIGAGLAGWASTALGMGRGLNLPVFALMAALLFAASYASVWWMDRRSAE